MTLSLPFFFLFLSATAAATTLPPQHCLRPLRPRGSGERSFYAAFLSHPLSRLAPPLRQAAESQLGVREPTPIPRMERDWSPSTHRQPAIFPTATTTRVGPRPLPIPILLFYPFLTGACTREHVLLLVFEVSGRSRRLPLAAGEPRHRRGRLAGGSGGGGERTGENNTFSPLSRNIAPPPE